jgi:hypothetical protein
LPFSHCFSTVSTVVLFSSWVIVDRTGSVVHEK